MLVFANDRSQRKLFFRVIVLCLILGIGTLSVHRLSRNRYLSTDLANPSFSVASRDQGHWSEDEAKSKCRYHGFGFDKEQRKTKKVYELILFSTELHWLSVRLHTLAHVVDYFVVVESPTTFTGRPKPLYLRDNWELFEAFHDKIIHRVIEDKIRSSRLWDHEDFLRNSLLTSVFPDLIGTSQEANADDVLIVSDVDEIIRPGVALLLRNCCIPRRLTFGTDFYYYSFQWQHRGRQWSHPDATVYRGPKTLLPNDLRQGLLGNGWAPIASFRRWWDRGTLWNAGWHCSSCFATLEETRTKMASFSHSKYNTGENRDRETIKSRVRNGQDLFGREMEIYDKIENNADIPPHILEHPRKYRFLLDRDGEDAGFDDAHMGEM